MTTELEQSYTLLTTINNLLLDQLIAGSAPVKKYKIGDREVEYEELLSLRKDIISRINYLEREEQGSTEVITVFDNGFVE